MFEADAESAQPGQAKSKLLPGCVRLLTRTNADQLVWWWVLLVACASGVLCLPFLRAVKWLGDEGVLLDGAQRMLQGGTLYKSFFEFLPPGGFILVETWLRIFGGSFLAARILAVLTIVGIACFTFLACRLVCKSSWLLAIAVIGWVIASQGKWTIVSHHWFTTLLSMVAAYMAISSSESSDARPRTAFIAGLAAGAAGMVIPTRGAFAMIAAFVPFANLRRRPAMTIAFLVAGAVAPFGLIGYLLATGALGPALNDVIVFAALHYSSIQWVPFGKGRDLQNLPISFLFPFAAILLLLLALSKPRYCRSHRLQTCFAFALAGLAGCFPRPDMTHILYVAPLAFPVLALALSKLAGSWRGTFRLTAMLFGLAVFVPAVRGYAWRAERALDARMQHTPRGNVVLIGSLASSAGPLLARIAASPPTDTFFFYPYLPLMPFLSGRPQQGAFDLFLPNYTLPAQYEAACFSVLRKATWVVIDSKWTNPAILKEVFPAMMNPRPRETVKFEAIIKRAFDLTNRFGRFELRHRRRRINADVCSAIDGKRPSR